MDIHSSNTGWMKKMNIPKSERILHGQLTNLVTVLEGTISLIERSWETRSDQVITYVGSAAQTLADFCTFNEDMASHEGITKARAAIDYLRDLAAQDIPQDEYIAQLNAQAEVMKAAAKSARYE
jgi:hypothetical protein